MLETHRAACRAVILAAAAVAAFVSPPARAWGPMGHQAVGAVADARLAPRTKLEVARLLAGDLGRDGAPSGRTTLAAVSVWADEIRGGDQDHPKWHYDNAPVCRAMPATADWCPLDECASRRIGTLAAVLADRQRTTRERNEALKWIVHLVGDMHMPLHASDYAQGATQVPVELEGHPDKHALTLHGAWDVRLVSAALHAGRSRRPPDAAIDALIRRADRLELAQIQAPPDRWLSESNELARGAALDYPGFACGSVPDAPVLLSRRYQQRAQGVIVERLALAGARLAELLNQALGHDP